MADIMQQAQGKDITFQAKGHGFSYDLRGIGTGQGMFPQAL